MKPISCIESLFCRHPQAFTQMLSHYYAFAPCEILSYFDKLNQPWLFRNEVARWDANTIATLIDKIDWKLFSEYSGAFSNHSLVEHFQDFIIWNDDKPGIDGKSIASNLQVGWTAELIEKFKNLLDFKTLSWNRNVEWSEKLIDQYCDKWDWRGLSSNNNLPWSEPFLNKYADKWKWWEIVFFNDNFPWSLTIARRFKKQLLDLDRNFLLDNGQLFQQPDIIDEFEEIIDWDRILYSSYLPWHEQKLQQRWAKHLAHYSFKYNGAFYSDPHYFEANLTEYIANYKAAFAEFSISRKLPWSLELIQRFESLWNFGYLSINSSLPWNEDLIDRYIDRWDWGTKKISITNTIRGHNGLINNSGIDWNIDLLLKYEQYIDFDALACEKHIWGKVLRFYMNTDLISKL